MNVVDEGDGRRLLSDFWWLLIMGRWRFGCSRLRSPWRQMEGNGRFSLLSWRATSSQFVSFKLIVDVQSSTWLVQVLLCSRNLHLFKYLFPYRRKFGRAFVGNHMVWPHNDVRLRVQPDPSSNSPVHSPKHQQKTKCQQKRKSLPGAPISETNNRSKQCSKGSKGRRL